MKRDLADEAERPPDWLPGRRSLDVRHSPRWRGWRTSAPAGPVTIRRIETLGGRAQADEPGAPPYPFDR